MEFNKDSPVGIIEIRLRDSEIREIKHIKNTNDIMNHIYRTLREKLDSLGFQRTKLEPNINVNVEYSFTMRTYKAIVTLSGRSILFKKFN